MVRPIGGSSYLQELMALKRVSVRSESASQFGRISIARTGASAPQASGASDDAASREWSSLLSELRRLTAERSQISTPVVATTPSQPAAASGTTRLVALNPQNTVDGLNSSQIATLNIDPISAGSQQQFTGRVTRAAAAATLQIVGDSEGRTTAGGRYELSGTLGSSSIELVRGELLTDVAERINADSNDTGVVAAIDGTSLRLSTTATGSSSSVRFETLEQDEEITTAYDVAQLQNVTLLSHARGATETLTGSVTGATTGQLTYHGRSGAVAAGTATFRLSGDDGSSTFTVSEGESLTDFAERVNAALPSTGVSAEVVGNEVRFSSVTAGAAAYVSIDQVDPLYETSVSGLNASQIADFDVQSMTDGAQVTLSGSVTQAASTALVSLAGSSGTIIDSATFSLRGSLGTVSLNVVAGESLSTAAGRINGQSENTGVVASVDGNSLRFTSADVGSDAVVDITLTDLTHYNSYSGANASQISSFAINSLTKGASETLSGTINTASTRAQLTHTGSLGLVGQTGTFTLTGNLGSRSFSVSALQSLSSLATSINGQSANTGVSAAVQGNNITFTSAGYGSSASIAVNVTSGSFSTTGGNGNGTANGTNATATINGQSLTAATNQFTHTDALGSFTFSVVQGYIGAISPIQVVSTPGSFALTGGNGSGLSYGSDALATINGQSLTGSGNRFNVTTGEGEFDLEFASGHTGTFDTITVASVADEFSFTGGNEAGIDYGTDAFALINGAVINAQDDCYVAVTENGEYELQFQSGFEGEFEPIEIESILSEVALAGADETGTNFGEDAEAEINGTSYISQTDGQFRLSNSYPRASISFQAGFQGDFDPVTVTRAARRVSVPVSRKVHAAPTKPRRTAADDIDDRIKQIKDRLSQLESAMRLLASSRAVEAYRKFSAQGAL